MNPKNPRLPADPRFLPRRQLLALGLSSLTLLALLVAPHNQAASLVLSSVTYPGTCRPWVQVNDDAFGLDDPSNQTPPHQAEEGFEVAVFKGQLYVGMEADNLYGARLWRTKQGIAIPHSQADWKEVAADREGNPFGLPNPVQNDHIDSLAEFNGYLHASTANRSGNDLGTLVYRSPSGDSGSWTQVNDPGFGDANNDNFKDMQVFQGWLCGGTGNDSTGAEVWCTNDRTIWLKKNESGFGDEANVVVWSGFVYEGALYFGVQNSENVAKLFRTTDLTGSPTWAQVYSGNPGSRRVDILGYLDGFLYISVRSSDGIVVLRSANGDAGTWSQVNTAGMDGDAQNVGAVVDSAIRYNGALYVGVFNVNTGFEVWRTTGNLQAGPLVDWVQVDGSGLGDPNNYYTELIRFNGYLYAWTSNYISGQQVRRSKCPICQSRAIAGTGTYTFDGVGAEITLSQENLDSLEVCVYPDAFSEEPMSDWPVKRHYEITPSPADGSFTADLTLSYDEDEFAASNIGAEETIYLLRWTGNAWAACPGDKRSRDTAANTVTCAGVTDGGTWAMAGSDLAPTGPPTPVSIMVRPVGGYGEPLSALELLAPWIILAVGLVMYIVIMSVVVALGSTCPVGG